jgi:hypothetical protein
MRQQLSATIGRTKVGKTSLSMVEILSMVTGRTLLGKPVPKALRCWFIGEDVFAEIERKFVAACTSLITLWCALTSQDRDRAESIFVRLSAAIDETKSVDQRAVDKALAIAMAMVKGRRPRPNDLSGDQNDHHD